MLMTHMIDQGVAKNNWPARTSHSYLTKLFHVSQERLDSQVLETATLTGKSVGHISQLIFVLGAETMNSPPSMPTCRIVAFALVRDRLDKVANDAEVTRLRSRVTA